MSPPSARHDGVYRERSPAVSPQSSPARTGDVLEAGKTGKCEDLVDVDKGQTVEAGRLGQSVSKMAGLVGCSQYAVVITYKKWSKEGRRTLAQIVEEAHAGFDGKVSEHTARLPRCVWGCVANQPKRLRGVREYENWTMEQQERVALGLGVLLGIPWVLASCWEYLGSWRPAGNTLSLGILLAIPWVLASCWEYLGSWHPAGNTLGLGVLLGIPWQGLWECHRLRRREAWRGGVYVVGNLAGSAEPGQARTLRELRLGPERRREASQAYRACWRSERRRCTVVALSQRSREAETAFLGVYKQLIEAPAIIPTPIAQSSIITKYNCEPDVLNATPCAAACGRPRARGRVGSSRDDTLGKELAGTTVACVERKHEKTLISRE
ncbi:hypothetical protein P4O66_004735 [Electrophorus voltai]|uniref:Uncharacterized protein n=1 Tax=Electrophorus voltai TaxID=2609070 RepID=A0AAD8ZP63_9TELE|nr:hypothetical protein P4O66_004735 [Electrophorus voltai]